MLRASGSESSLRSQPSLAFGELRLGRRVSCEGCLAEAAHPRRRTPSALLEPAGASARRAVFAHVHAKAACSISFIVAATGTAAPILRTDCREYALTQCGGAGIPTVIRSVTCTESTSVSSTSSAATSTQIGTTSASRATWRRVSIGTILGPLATRLHTVPGHWSCRSNFRLTGPAVWFEKYLKSGSGRAFAKRHFSVSDAIDLRSRSQIRAAVGDSCSV